MSKLKKTQAISNGNTGVKKQNSLDYSKSKPNFKRYTIPGSQFEVLWNKATGYSVGIENIRITKDFGTLNEAMNTIGYHTEEIKEGKETYYEIKKYGVVEFEVIAHIAKAIIAVNMENFKKEIEELITKNQKNEQENN